MSNRSRSDELASNGPGDNELLESIEVVVDEGLGRG
jgi:hypothetical protein